MKNTKRKTKNKKQKEEGITLIALIITIIVLLILAGITIGALTSNNSVLKQAGSAKKETVESEEAEKVQIAIMDAVANASTTVSGELTTEFVKNAIKNQFGEDAVAKVTGDGPWEYEGEYKTYQIEKTGEILGPNATIAKDSSPEKREYYLPRGGTYKEGTVDTGLVITYKGSEFVWIPVNSNLEVLGKNGVSTGKKMAKIYSLDSNTVDSKGKTKYEGVLYDFDNLGPGVRSKEMTNYGQDTENFREPAYLTHLSYGDASTSNSVGITEDLLQEEYDEMIDSVIKYGGFYVGRYESSLNGTVAASIAGVKPMSAAEAEGNKWYGLYQKQKEFTGGSDSMVAGMIWGSQYDAMLNWMIGTEKDKEKVIQNTNGNHEGSVLNCGSFNGESDKINNIYDLEGNLFEWTKEAHSNSVRDIRGGYFVNIGTPNSPSYRNSLFGPNLDFPYFGSRLTLYIR